MRFKSSKQKIELSKLLKGGAIYRWSMLECWEFVEEHDNYKDLKAAFNYLKKHYKDNDFVIIKHRSYE